MSLMPRQRISDALVESAQRGIAVVVAAAGYGKTEAARDAFPGSCYVGLDSQSEVGAVAKQLVRMAAPRYVRVLGSLLQRPDTAENRRHLAGWVAERLPASGFTIVLDDFHHANAHAEVAGFVRRVIEATVPRVRWVIASREEPELPIAAWISRGWMSFPLGEADLELSDDEARGLAAAVGVAADATSVAEMRADTLGWPIAMRLALSAWARVRALPPVRLRTREMLHDYIESEIWSGIEPSDRCLLEAGALLAEPDPALLRDAGFTNAAAALARLSRRIPLVQRLGPNAFRLHDLFRDHVLAQLRSDEARFAATVECVAASLVRAGSARDALRLYIDAADAERILATLEASGFALIASGDRRIVAEALWRLGRGFAQYPVALAMHGALYHVDGKAHAAEVALRRALECGPPPALRIEITRRLAVLDVNHGKADAAIALLEPLLCERAGMSAIAELRVKATLACARAIVGDAQEAHRLIDELEIRLPMVEDELRLDIQGKLGFAAFYAGNFVRARELTLVAAEGATELGFDYNAAQAYNTLVNATYMLDGPASAYVAYAAAMERAAARAGDRRLEDYAVKSLLVASAMSGDDELFRRSAERLGPTQETQGFRQLLPCRMARVVNAVGATCDFAGAVRALTSIERKQLSEAENVLRDSALAVIYAAEGDRTRAAALLDRRAAVCAPCDQFSRRNIAEAQAYRAFALWLLGRRTAALRAIDNDKTASFGREPEIRTAVIAICASPRGSLTADRLGQILAPLERNELTGLARFLRRLLENALEPAVAEPLSRPGPSVPCNLTRSELAVLHLLPSPLTYKEIAAARGVSENTIKIQVSAIRAKLQAGSRLAAVTIGRRRGYLHEG